MSRIRLRNTSRLRLTDMLRKRKMTLKMFVDELGITTHESLIARCNRMGVEAPSVEEFSKLGIAIVTNPTEGVIVLEPPPVILEQTGKPVEENVETLPLKNGFVELQDKHDVTQTSHKKSKKKKDGFYPRQITDLSQDEPVTEVLQEDQDQV